MGGKLRERSTPGRGCLAGEDCPETEEKGGGAGERAEDHPMLPERVRGAAWVGGFGRKKVEGEVSVFWD